ncbi:MAG: PQQ-binding-like beta-propeller repeat protein [Gemmataceae bacterium]
MRSMSALVVTCLLASAVVAQDAPRFLAESRTGASAATLPTTWDRDTNVRWKADIPGAGWSCPVVSGGRVYLTSTVSDEPPGQPRKGLYIADLQGKSLPGEHRWTVHCLDAATGKRLWSRVAFQGKMAATLHLKNSLASETPVTDGKHVWALFGNVGVACFTRDGAPVWSQRLPAMKTRMGWGTGASPALHAGRLFLVNDNEEKSYVQALDALTGKERWRTGRDEGSNWATPFVWVNAQRTELVTAGTKKVRSYDLDGKLLWELAGMSVISIPTPFAAGDLLYVSSGYVLDPFLKPIYAIRPGASGDISLAKGETSNRFIAWCQPQAGAYHPTPLVYQGYLYVLLDRGFLACYDAKTGAEVYRRRLGGGSAGFTASPWAYDGKVFCLSEDGETCVVEAGKTFQVLGRNRLDEMALATPTVADGSVFLRTQSKLYCLRNAGR